MELYQRIEQLISKRLPLYHTVEEEVMSLMERVTEAQRHARMVSMFRLFSSLCLSTCFSGDAGWQWGCRQEKKRWKIRR